MKHLLFFILLFPVFIYSQSKKDLTSEERAYLYHTVKNSPILNKHIGQYFEYLGPEILFPNKEINYDSLGTYLSLYPDSLIIHNSELAKAPKGLVTEALNKISLWKLNRILMAKRGTETELEPFKEAYEEFAAILVENLPPIATKEISGKLMPHPKLDNVLNPMLGFDDKIAMLASYQFITQNDQLVIINAITTAINEYISLKTSEYYLSLGGNYTYFKNIVIAAGDGTISSPTFEDRETHEKSKWLNGLPKTVGLIPFQSKFTQGSGAIASKIDPFVCSVNDFITPDNYKTCNIHLDVWGYNTEKQVTVIIEKNGLCYPLFNSGETRFLSPDSSFTKGGTFKQKMNDLEFKKIKDINQMIYGKKGYDYWIAYNNKMKDKTELIIIKLEKKYSDYGYSTVSVSKKKTKKSTRNKKDPSKLNDYSISNHKEADARKKTQDEIVRQHAIFDEYKRKIKELEIEKKQALELLALYNRRLDDYKLALGNHWAKYKEKKGIYTFEDSTTFNIYTQEFQFPAKSMSEQFEIRVLSIPEECLSNIYDEVMMHINVIDEIKYYDAAINNQFQNQFTENQYSLNSSALFAKDSFALKNLYNTLLFEKKKIKFEIAGGGIGIFNGSRIIKDQNTANKNHKDSTENKLNFSELIIDSQKDFTIIVNTFTHNKECAFNTENPEIILIAKNNNLSKNDLLTLYRSAVLLEQFKSDFLKYASIHLQKEAYDKISKKINKSWNKIEIKCGKTKIKLSIIEKEIISAITK
ncbi:MAG: hypothetical protein HYR91_05190 [Flavobacteriia bacterium]|nr:hypothetical protein [Flavobacteriia bacterium]